MGKRTKNEITQDVEVVNSNDRVKKLNSYFSSACIEPCEEHALAYSGITEDEHTANCLYCKYSNTEEHTIQALTNSCEYCGYGEGATICTLTFPQTATASVEGYAATDYLAVLGHTVKMPECSYVPEGWRFIGWKKMDERPSSIEAADFEEVSCLHIGDSYEVKGDETFFARYRYDFKETWEWDDSQQTVALTIQAGNDNPISVDIEDDDVIWWSTEPTADTEGDLSALVQTRYVHDNTTYKFNTYSKVPLYFTYELNEEDNTSTITTYADKKGNVKLNGRTLYKDGSWNTLCLPFDVWDGDETDGVTFSGTPLEGADVKVFTDAAFADGCLTLNFDDATAIEAGRPCLITWAENSGEDLLSPTFPSVTFSDATDDDRFDMAEGMAITFCGTYKKLSYDSDDKSILFLGSNNTLYYPMAGASIGAQRAYFTLEGLVAGEPAAGANAISTFILNFGDGETASITLPSATRGGEADEDAWYTLDGRKLSGKPTMRGVYVSQGRKILVR